MGAERERIAIVTGANSGIGKHTASALAEEGFRVVMAVRSVERGAQAARDIEGADVAELDLASLDSVRRFAGSFVDTYGRLDVLVNNAAFADWGNDRRETVDAFERTFGTNHLGPFLLTNLLGDTLAASCARVVNVTSEFGYKLTGDGLDWDDLQATRGYNGVIAYGRSKLANIYFTIELARRLQSTGVVANCVCPGYVATNLGVARDDEKATVDGAPSDQTVDVSWLPDPLPPELGALGPVFLATDPAVAAVSGEFFRGPKQARLRAPATDAEAPARLWDISERLVGLRVASL